ncbi:hypothetical protein ACRHK7_01215 [Weissella tructae]|uniref:hypothetical protein n=1 Tax=Weissella tructae TaxID=887702 RepID=UPI003D8EE008
MSEEKYIVEQETLSNGITPETMGRAVVKAMLAILQDPLVEGEINIELNEQARLTDGRVMKGVNVHIGAWIENEDASEIEKVE